MRLYGTEEASIEPISGSTGKLDAADDPAVPGKRQNRGRLELRDLDASSS